MGERAYAAYQRDDGLFNVHYSHWGAGRLAERITEETPLGGESSEPGFVTALTSALEKAVDDVDGEISGYVTEAQETTEIEPQPFATGVTMRDITQGLLDYLDIEGLVVVTRDWQVHEFVTYWTGFGHGDGDYPGLLAYPYDHSYWWGKYQGFRTYLKERIEREEITPEEAEEELIHLLLKEYEDPLDKFILPISSALKEEHWTEYTGAFHTCMGRSRVLGEMYPKDVHKLPEWAVPSDFPEVKTKSGERVSIVQD